MGQERHNKWIIAVVSSVMGGAGAAFVTAACVTAGIAVTGPAAVVAGASGLAGVGVIGLMGGAVGGISVFRDNKKAFALTALFTGMAMAGAGLTAYETGKGFGMEKTGKIAVPVSNGLQRAFDAGVDPDRLKRIREDIAAYANSRMAAEAAGNYELCAQNPEAFAKRGIKCDIYRPVP